MKLRKILAGFLAGAVAVGSMVFTASAAEDTTVATNVALSTISMAADSDNVITGFDGYNWAASLSCDDYSKIEMVYDVTTKGDASALALVINSGESDVNGTSWKDAGDWNLATGTDKKLTIDLSALEGKTFSFIGYQLYGSAAGATGTTDITIKSVTLYAASTTEEEPTPDVPAATDPYIYTYDGSPVELTVAASEWAPNGFAAQKNIAFTPTGFTAKTTTFAELKALYSGLTVKDWAVTNLPDDISTDNLSVSIYIQFKSDYSGWKAIYDTSATFADITEIADTDPIMDMGFQINYNLTADNTATYKAGDVITLNGEEEEPTPDTPAEEEGFDQTKADVEAAAESGDILMQTATFGDVEAVRYTKVVSSKEIENAKSVTFTFESKDANGNVIGTGTYTSNKYYTSLMASGAKVDAPENYVFLSLTVKDIPDGVTLKCTGITLS